MLDCEHTRNDGREHRDGVLICLNCGQPVIYVKQPGACAHSHAHDVLPSGKRLCHECGDEF